MNNLEIYNEKSFDEIKHIDEDGNEFWYARELQSVLEYKEWRKFEGVINKAMISCIQSKQNALEHFVGADKMVDIGSDTQRKIDDYKLSRYACYLIAQNGDSRKKAIALAQTYFATQTRKQEIIESMYKDLPEDKKRLKIRSDIKTGNYALNQAALDAGVKNFDKFHNAGYKGLYNGETADDIAKRKGLSYREEILDYMGSAELGANIFRITMTDELLRKQEEKDEKKATNTHYIVGNAIRNTINELGETMPEDLPTPEKSLKKLEKEERQALIEEDIYE